MLLIAHKHQRRTVTSVHPTLGRSTGSFLEKDIRRNGYLHYILDEWFEEVVKPRLKGEAHEIRFADDGAHEGAKED